MKLIITITNTTENLLRGFTQSHLDQQNYTMNTMLFDTDQGCHIIYSYLFSLDALFLRVSLRAKY